MSQACKQLQVSNNNSICVRFLLKHAEECLKNVISRNLGSFYVKTIRLFAFDFYEEMADSVLGFIDYSGSIASYKNLELITNPILYIKYVITCFSFPGKKCFFPLFRFAFFFFPFAIFCFRFLACSLEERTLRS